MHLPAELDVPFRTTVAEIGEQPAMRYITSIERLAMAEGEAKGFVEGRLGTLRETIPLYLQARFGALPPKLMRQFQELSQVKALEELLQAAQTSPSLTDFQKMADRISAN